MIKVLLVNYVFQIYINYFYNCLDARVSETIDSSDDEHLPIFAGVKVKLIDSIAHELA